MVEWKTTGWALRVSSNDLYYGESFDVIVRVMK